MAAYGLWAQAIEAEDDERLNELTAACHTALAQLSAEPSQTAAFRSRKICGS